MKNKIFNIISNVLFVVLIISTVFLVVRNTCFISIVVSGNSMSPTLKTNEYGYANKTRFAINNIERFDIITFDIERNEETTGLIKRVIGLPGETLEFRGEECSLYVNNVYVEQDFITADIQKLTGKNLNYGYELNTPIILDEDSYFVLGDNRGVSHDSLHGLGLVSKKSIVGVLTCIIGSCESLKEEDVLICEGKRIGNVRFF